MEDILASIRRILSEDEAPAGAAGPTAPESAPAAGGEADNHVLVLDAAMMVPEPAQTVVEMPMSRAMPPVPPPAVAMAPTGPMAPTGLVAPEAAAAAASSVGSLMRTLAAERTMQVHSGGPTIEDIVREELRPLLKAWLDANLPPMVERLVRVELERVVGRAVP
jgi:uncharacterized protein